MSKNQFTEKGALLGAYEVEIESNYPLLEDELDEKQNDIAEINAKVMSKKRYMKKWYGMTDDEVIEELAQIKAESDMIEPMPSVFNYEEETQEEGAENQEGTGSEEEELAGE
jgi:uncharacterized protein YydD (DUF2326 family)